MRAILLSLDYNHTPASFTHAHRTPTMSLPRSLRGGCHCGRNTYIIDIPQQTDQSAQVLFDTDSIHLSPLATPLAAFLRIPLAWYSSTTHAFFPDETHHMIRRVFESQSPSQQQTKRQFCGFCGTPLTFWTERPQSEAGFIQLTLASLRSSDLRDLDDMGLVPGSSSDEEAESDIDAVLGARETGQDDVEEDIVMQTAEDTPGGGNKTPHGGGSSSSSKALTGFEERGGVPWFHSLVSGSRLGKVHRKRGFEQSQDGTTRVEWEILEWNGDDDGDENNSADEAVTMVGEADGIDPSINPGKRKLRDRGDSDAAGAAADVS